MEAGASEMRIPVQTQTGSFIPASKCGAVHAPDIRRGEHISRNITGIGRPIPPPDTQFKKETIMSADSLSPAATIQIKRLSGRIGAEVSGVKLGRALDSATVAEIRSALLAHKVLFFRDQSHLNDNEQEEFGRLLGAPFNHPTVPVENGTDHIFNVKSDGERAANQWHTDITFVDAYPQISILRGITIPSVGGDTVWANTAAAYNDLPEPIRALADRLWALHTNKFDYAAPPTSEKSSLNFHRDIFSSTVFETEHPVVRVHPETGEKTIVLGNFVQRILGVSRDDSAHIFQILQSYITRLENTVRWSWTPGDVAIWDNRATQHYGIGDFNEPRELHRVTIEGDVPVSIDGRRSHTRNSYKNPESIRIAAE